VFKFWRNQRLVTEGVDEDKTDILAKQEPRPGR
jgi:hypothetical protein